MSYVPKTQSLVLLKIKNIFMFYFSRKAPFIMYKP